MKITQNFSLNELIESPTARRKGFNEQFLPPQIVVKNLISLCINVLQPLRVYLGVPIIVTSGYRCGRLNRSIKGAVNSQHMIGEAVDIRVPNMQTIDICKAVIEERIEFDQMIEEYGVWVHISFKEGKNRMQVLQKKHGKPYANLIL